MLQQMRLACKLFQNKILLDHVQKFILPKNKYRYTAYTRCLTRFNVTALKVNRVFSKNTSISYISILSTDYNIFCSDH